MKAKVSGEGSAPICPAQRVRQTSSKNRFGGVAGACRAGRSAGGRSHLVGTARESLLTPQLKMEKSI